MFEMLITIVAAAVAAIYGLSKSIFMNGPNQHLYRILLLVGIAILLTYTYLYRNIKRANIKELNVNVEDYLYYDKFTSLLYRIGYFLSYLIQNILFDYTYMKRNFNFCKGLDVYDDGVSEYYIKFRNTWYKYMQLTMKRHHISLKKLQSFAAGMKNDMILAGMESEEEKYVTLLYAEQIREYYDEHKQISMPIMKMFPLHKGVNRYFLKNLYIHYKVASYVEKHEPEIADLIKLQDFRSKRDVNDFKKMNLK